MKHLLDVNVLLAAIWSNHPKHAETFQALQHKKVMVCPIAELGFLRISTHKKVFNAPMEQARILLKRFLDERKAGWVADDLPALESKPKASETVTDTYLADLASKHGFRLATLDAGIKHPSVDVIA